jgi:hypothetical protein
LDAAARTALQNRYRRAYTAYYSLALCVDAKTENGSVTDADLNRETAAANELAAARSEWLRAVFNDLSV